MKSETTPIKSVERQTIVKAEHVDEGHTEGVYLELSDGRKIVITIDREYAANMNVTIYQADLTQKPEFIIP